MDQIKIGKFIAECRKKNNLTQMQLAEKLNITDRAISKWENGKGMPDSSIMLDLCNELKISVNELLCGELIEMNNYNEVAEKTLLEMAQKEEMQNKKLMMYENVIGFSSAISFLILIFVTSFLVENNIAKIVLFILAFILLIIGVFNDALYTIGTNVKITYDGTILESYPAQVKATKIEIKSAENFEILFKDRQPIDSYNKIYVVLDKSETDKYNYTIYAYDGSVNIKIDGKEYSLKDALLESKITMEEIIQKANKDLDNNKITGDMYKDGGSMIYQYDTYTIIKCHTIEGNRDVYIGTKEMTLNDVR